MDQGDDEGNMEYRDARARIHQEMREEERREKLRGWIEDSIGTLLLLAILGGIYFIAWGLG